MFKLAVSNQMTETTNGMVAFKDTSNPLVDLFFAIGASRGKDIIPQFVAAYVVSPEIATRIAMWARDVRGGAGERELFRAICTHLEQTNLDSARALMRKIPLIGRWDDLLVFTGPLQKEAFAMIKHALLDGNGLCAKWMPRQGDIATALRTFMGFSPKQWRKLLVSLTKVVETQMCAKDWDNINFAHVPSLASSRYKKAFARNTPKFAEYVEKLASGEEKVNAGAVYPYDVLKDVESADYIAKQHIIAQWNALPNYVGDASILPMVDVSGSMGTLIGGKGKVSCMDVAVSLGLYLSQKNTGKFSDMFLTFSEKPELLRLRGDIVSRYQQMKKSEWGMNTNIEKAMQRILDVAVQGNVPQEEMPQILLILSDMQFDASSMFGERAIEMTRRMFADRGYTMPTVVFWNIDAHDNVPVKFNESGVAMISGFSPSIMKSVLGANFDTLNPYSIMMDTVMIDRYNF